MGNPKQLFSGLTICVIAIVVTIPITYGLIRLFGGYSIIGNNIQFIVIGIFLVVVWLPFFILPRKSHKKKQIKDEKQ